MKMGILFKSAMIAVAAGGIMLFGCKKEDIDTDTQTSQDNAQAEFIYNDANNIVDDAARNEAGIYKNASSMLPVCAVISRDTINNTDPDTLTIDFGTTNCQGMDGRYRRGKIIAIFTGRYRDAGTVTTITFGSYYVNDYKVEGTKTITNNGVDTITGYTSYRVIVQSAKITNPAGKSISWDANHMRTWIAGNSTPSVTSDDIYLVTGSANGTSINGNTFTTNITTALRVELSCKNIVSGTVDLTPSGKPTRTLDFGGGACDNKATVTIKGNTYNITLN